MTDHHKQALLQITRRLSGEAETLALGRDLAPGLRPGMVIYLCGDLGAGKTTLARGLLRGLGVTERVKSPTFTIVEPYTISTLYLYHFDFYRYNGKEEWTNSGLRDYFDSRSICLIEWPEKVGPQLPAPDLRIALEFDGNGRTASLSALTEAGRNCLIQLQN